MMPIVRVAAPVMESEPLVQVKLRGELPRATDFVLLMFRVLEPGPVMVGGLKPPVAPMGKPTMPKVVTPAKPLVAVMVTLYDVLPPARMLCEAGLAVSA